jgi:hypothetical protein
MVTSMGTGSFGQDTGVAGCHHSDLCCVVLVLTYMDVQNGDL